MVRPTRMVPVSAARRAAAMAGCIAANSLRRKCWPKVMRSKPSSRAVRTCSMVSWKRSTSGWPGGCWFVRISPKRTVAPPLLSVPSVLSPSPRDAPGRASGDQREFLEVAELDLGRPVGQLAGGRHEQADRSAALAEPLVLGAGDLLP